MKHDHPRTAHVTLGSTIVNNAPPVVILAQGKATSSGQLQGPVVVTLTPASNFSQNYSLVSGGKAENGELPVGSPVPLPLVRTYNSLLEIDNISTQQQSGLLAGIYTFNGKSTVAIGTAISPYQSAGGQTLAEPQTLTLTNISNQAALAIVCVGSDDPQCYALNTDPNTLPPQWKDLKNFTAVANNVFQAPTKNYFGQFMFIINVSLTPGVSIQSSLL